MPCRMFNTHNNPYMYITFNNKTLQTQDMSTIEGFLRRRDESRYFPQNFCNFHRRRKFNARQSIHVFNGTICCITIQKIQIPVGRYTGMLLV
jgi:hypothetical protein